MKNRAKEDKGQTDEALQERLQELVEQETQHIDRLKRLQAEFDNYKKRIARETASLEERISDTTILDFLPLYDSLERAFATYTEDADTEALVSGLEMIRAQFEQTLETRGVKRIECIGKPFDPTFHEALLSVDSEEEKNTIIDELSSGYLRNERPLRVSKVVVSRGPGVEASEEEQ